MAFQTVFKRSEMKYLLNKEQYKIIRNVIEPHMRGDEYGRSTICNLYFDTPSYLLIRRSMEKPVYKEKLRLRTYGVAAPDSTAFVEIKKKYNSIVYKRRISMTYKEAEHYLYDGERLMDSQISHEIDYFLSHYEDLRAAVFLSYERQAFYASDNHDFRVTFDENILWRDYDLDLCKGVYGTPILQDGEVLMEIKTGVAIPLWMTRCLSENHIYKTSFSKYGKAYVTKRHE